uniref:Uncharacterized protein n=1 Tax=Octopus bimaculoides TaxID=37653 RepID=A0A0L8GVQ0_OCTBM
MCVYVCVCLCECVYVACICRGGVSLCVHASVHVCLWVFVVIVGIVLCVFFF